MAKKKKEETVKYGFEDAANAFIDKHLIETHNCDVHKLRSIEDIKLYQSLNSKIYIKKSLFGCYCCCEICNKSWNIYNN